MFEDDDEIRVFVVDENGKELQRYACVQWSGGLHVGQEIPLTLDGHAGIYRVRGVRPGEGGRGRFVQVIETMACPFCKRGLRDEYGHVGLNQDHVICRHCGRRVAMEPVPAPPGIPAAFRVASKQDVEKPKK